MDNRLKGLAKHTHTKYTRYADDLAFSGAHIGIGMVSYIKKIVEECGFKLNEKKSDYITIKVPKYSQA